MATIKSSIKTGKGTLPLNVPPLPPATAPDAPPDFVKISSEQSQGLKKPTSAQINSAGAAANEVATSPSYTADFGQKAVAPDTMAASLRRAAAWSAEEARAKRWYQFVHQQSSLAWEDALGQQEAFKADYTAGVRHDPTIIERYPSLGAVVNARSEAAKRGAETKRTKKAAEKAAAANGDASKTATTPAPATGSSGTTTH